MTDSECQRHPLRLRAWFAYSPHMTSTLDAVIDDLAAEQAALEAALERLPAAAWEKTTHAPGWSVRDQVAHLLQFDTLAAAAIRAPETFHETLRQPGNREAAYLARARDLAPAALFEQWRTQASDLIRAARTLDPAVRVPWAGPAMSGVSFITARLMETWSHGLDVIDVTGVPRPDTDRLRHVAFLGVRARPYSYTNRGTALPDTPVHVSLTAPSGAIWEFGEPGAENRVTGSAGDFCRVVTRRRHIDDTNLNVQGTAAAEWMAIAQAFAGPPGDGRKPGQFPRESTS